MKKKKDFLNVSVFNFAKEILKKKKKKKKRAETSYLICFFFKNGIDGLVIKSVRITMIDFFFQICVNRKL